VAGCGITISGFEIQDRQTPIPGSPVRGGSVSSFEQLG
jgi:hypothetical protein